MMTNNKLTNSNTEKGKPAERIWLGLIVFGGLAGESFLLYALVKVATYFEYLRQLNFPSGAFEMNVLPLVLIGIVACMGYLLLFVCRAITNPDDPEYDNKIKIRILGTVMAFLILWGIYALNDSSYHLDDNSAPRFLVMCLLLAGIPIAFVLGILNAAIHFHAKYEAAQKQEQERG